MIIREEDYVRKKDLNEVATIYEKYTDERVEFLVYAYKKGASFTLKLLEGKEAVELFFVSRGSLKVLTTGFIVRARDMIVLTPEDPLLTVDVLEDTELYSFSSLVGCFSKPEESYHLVDENMKKLEYKDQYTKIHCVNVMKLGRRMVPYLDLTEKEAYAFLRACQYHDIGKIGISDEILNKQGKHTAKEQEVMRTHSEECRLHLSAYYDPLVVETALMHHERLDGSGYPYGLKGEEITKLGRAIAVLDTYDAMISKRVYKEAKSKEEALRELDRLSGTLYDPECIAILKRILKEEEGA